MKSKSQLIDALGPKALECFNTAWRVYAPDQVSEAATQLYKAYQLGVTEASEHAHEKEVEIAALQRVLASANTFTVQTVTRRGLITWFKHLFT